MVCVGRTAMKTAEGIPLYLQPVAVALYSRQSLARFPLRASKKYLQKKTELFYL